MDQNESLNEQTIASRLTHFIEHYTKLSVNAFADNAGLKPANVYKMLKGEQTITGRTINLICSAYNINKKWLIDGEGEVFMPGFEKNSYRDILIKGRNTGDINEVIFTLVRLLEEKDVFVNKLISILEEKDKVIDSLTKQLCIFINESTIKNTSREEDC